jgi:hypothetical protein
VVVGVALVGVGALWTAANLGRLDLLTTLRTYWPALLVVWGLLELYNWAALRPAAPPPPTLFDDQPGNDDSGRLA